MQLVGLLRSAARVGSAGAFTAGLLVSASAAAADTAERAHGAEQPPAPVGVIYGGATAQQFPVVIEVSADGTQVVHARVAIRLRCSAGGTVTIPDRFDGLAISRRSRFGDSFGPQITRNADGTTTDIEGRVTGQFNATRRRASGTWQFKATHHDAAGGAATDTCDSGRITWRAKQ